VGGGTISLALGEDGASAPLAVQSAPKARLDLIEVNPAVSWFIRWFNRLFNRRSTVARQWSRRLAVSK